MAVVDWVGAGMEVVLGRHAGQSQGVVACRSTSPVRGEDAVDTRSHNLPGAQLWVGLSCNWSVFRGRL